MKTFYRILAKSTAAFFAVLFVVTALLSVVLVTLGSRLFNPNLYKSALLKQQVYDQLPEIIADMLITSTTYNPCAADPIRCDAMAPKLATCYIEALGIERFSLLTNSEEQPSDAETILIQSCFAQFNSDIQAEDASAKGGIPIYFRNLTADNWAAIIRRILPPGELQIMVEDTLDGVFAYLKGDAAQVTISMQTVKDRLAGATGEQVLRELITSQQDCTVELLDIFTGKRELDELVLCNPPELLLPFTLSLTRMLADEAIASIPDEVVILPPKGEGTGAADALLWVRRARVIMFLSPLVPLVFLGLVTMFGVRTLKGWLRWWGIPFTIAGALGAGASLAVILAWKPAWEKWVTPRFPAYLGAEFASLVQSLAGDLARDLALWIGLAGLILLLLGLTMWVTARVGKKKVVVQERPLPAPEA